MSSDRASIPRARTPLRQVALNSIILPKASPAPECYNRRGPTVARELIHRGRKIQVLLDTTVLTDGTVIRRDVILHPGAVVILPIVDAHHVCLLRNHRFIV